METETPPNLIDLLDQLNLPSEPGPVSLMPATWGWIVVALLLAALIGWIFRRGVHHRRANAYRRAAESAIERAGDDPAEIALILRQTALAAYPRAEVAGLSGEEWLAFLDETAGTTLFTRGIGRCVAGAPYRPAEPVPELTPIAIRWVRTHRANPETPARRHMAWPGEVT